MEVIKYNNNIITVPIITVLYYYLKFALRVARAWEPAVVLKKTVAKLVLEFVLPFSDRCLKFFMDLPLFVVDFFVVIIRKTQISFKNRKIGRASVGHKVVRILPLE